MLESVSAPFRTARSLGRILVMTIVMYIPVVGVFWATGWLLDHQRNVAREDEHEVPGLEFSSDRITSGLWATVISWVWSSPAVIVFALVGGGLAASQVIVPLTQELSHLSSAPDMDTLVVQQQLTVAMTDSMLPAIGLFVLIVYVGAILSAPIVAAATARYNIDRTPREGFRLKAVFSALRASGSLSLKASGITLLTQLISLLFLALAWPFLVRSAAIMGPVFDPTTMVAATSSYLTFVLIANIASMLTVPLQVAAYTGWGVWTREVSRLRGADLHPPSV